MTDDAPVSYICGLRLVPFLRQVEYQVAATSHQNPSHSNCAPKCLSGDSQDTHCPRIAGKVGMLSDGDSKCPILQTRFTGPDSLPSGWNSVHPSATNIILWPAESLCAVGVHRSSVISKYFSGERASGSPCLLLLLRPVINFSIICSGTPPHSHSEEER